MQIGSIDANSELSIQKHQSDATGDISITSENELWIIFSAESYSYEKNVTSKSCVDIAENYPAQASSTKELKRVKIEKWNKNLITLRLLLR